jgi:hypothetical protein
MGAPQGYWNLKKIVIKLESKGLIGIFLLNNPKFQDQLIN